MTKRLLIVCALFLSGTAAAQILSGVAAAQAQTGQPAAQATDGTATPPARLIKPHPARPETRPTERPHRPVDDRCKPLKDQLELALQKPTNQRRVFQARVAHNAGTRFCREGHADKGMAEFQRGLSYLQDANSH